MTSAAVPDDSSFGQVAHRARGLTDSSLAGLLTRAAGRDVVDLAVGTPRFPVTEPTLVEAAVAALRAGHNQYLPPQGEATLRQSIAGSFDTPADPDTEITITAGGTEALCVALQSVLDPGDEVVLLEPFYENFLGAVRLAGGVPRHVSLREPDWRLPHDELRKAFGPRTKAIILNSPSNPTGRMLGEEDLELVAELCERWNAVAVSDEVYCHLVFDGRHHRSVADVPGLRERAIVVGSLSKSHAISGWRLGYLRATAQRTRVLRRVHEVTTSGTVAPLQISLGQVGIRPALARERAAALQAHRDEVTAAFAGLGISFGPVEGGCFAFGRLDDRHPDCDSFATALLEERGVLIAPGRPFFSDPKHGDRFVRIAFNRPRDVIATARERLS
ncbi:pyridoxal phosphate-dependent aminotransferase [Streptomyces sp. NPDC054794]